MGHFGRNHVLTARPRALVSGRVYARVSAVLTRKGNLRQDVRPHGPRAVIMASTFGTRKRSPRDWAGRGSPTLEGVKGRAALIGVGERGGSNPGAAGSAGGEGSGTHRRAPYELLSRVRGQGADDRLRRECFGLAEIVQGLTGVVERAGDSGGKGLVFCRSSTIRCSRNHKPDPSSRQGRRPRQATRSKAHSRAAPIGRQRLRGGGMDRGGVRTT